MKDYASNRPYYVRLHLMDRFDLSDTIAVAIQNQDPEMGYVQINSIRVDKSFSGVYFKDASPSLEAKAKYGYEFVKWDELDSVTTEKFLLNENAVLKPIFQERELSHYSSIVVINELSAKQDSMLSQGDWIEFYNTSKDTVDLSGWKVVSNDNEFVFPDSSKIQPKGYLLLSANPQEMVLMSKGGQVFNVSLGFGLSSKKEKLLLIDAENNIVDSLRYDIEIDFPTLLDSGNKNIERVNPLLDNWEASVKPSPGMENVLYEPIKTKKIEKQGNSVFYIVGVVVLFGLLLMGMLLIRKKRNKG